MSTRTLPELINLQEPGWTLVEDCLQKATVPVEILAAPLEAREAALLQIQVTTRSPMGAIIHQCAGIFFDHGWLRVLAAGNHPRLNRSLPDWNGGRSNGFCLFADDVMGGFFALNGGALGSDLGNVYYFAPDTLEWEPNDLTYSEFISWCGMEGSLSQYYETMRWPGWEEEVKRITGDQALSIYPFLGTDFPGAKTPIKDRHRRPVPIGEIYSLLGAGDTESS